MTIALDATYSCGEGLTGVGLYSREMLWGLPGAHPEARFQFCYRAHRFFGESRRERLPANARRALLAEPWGPRRADLFHGLNQRLPRMAMRRAVATFHDLFVISGEYSTAEFRARFRQQALDAAERAHRIIAVSEFTKGQVVQLLGVEASRVRVVHHGVRAPAPVAGIFREPLILAVGAIQKRKNTARLVNAFEAVRAPWRLVLAGAAGYGADEAMAEVERSAARRRIIVTGYISAAELAEWYARASVFAFPSLDEGFGMPVLEAMAAGVPVLTSNRSALPEVAGDAALLVDPEQTEAIAEGLRQLTQHAELRNRLAERGRARARLFTWEKAVQETWAVYKELW